jgi:hypothetical protein
MRTEAAKAAAAESADPWRLALARVRGKVDFYDQLERVSSQTLLDLLEVPQGALPLNPSVWARPLRGLAAGHGANYGKGQVVGASWSN